jgi:ribosomal protein L29
MNMAEMRTELQEITIKLTQHEFKLVTAGLANLAEPGSVKLTQVNNYELRMQAAELNERLLATRATYLTGLVESAVGMKKRAQELLDRVRDAVYQETKDDAVYRKKEKAQAE